MQGGVSPNPRPNRVVHSRVERKNMEGRSAASIPETEVRQIVRLLSEVAVLNGDHAQKKRALMNGLQKLVDADGWLWSMTRVDYQTKTPISVGLIHQGLSDKQLMGWLEASQTPSCPPPEDAPLSDITRTGQHFTRTRQQVVSDEDWYSHPAVIKHRLAVGLDHFLYSVYPLDEPDMYSAIGLFRFRGREAFTPLEAKIAHILLSEVKWLHFAELPRDEGRYVPKLTPRQRVVLIMLIEARDKDEIARLLHISPHTAKDHIKAVYQHFEVSSQLELIRRFRFGDGGDGSAAPALSQKP
jgi:DNA-binding CsgD family transcriptional regulator